MSKEYTCDNCQRVFHDRDWNLPVDERRDYCSEECFNEAKEKGQVIECPTCLGEVTVPHNCAWKNRKSQPKSHKESQ